MFIDDSEQRHPPRRGLGHLLAVGGLVVPEQQIHPLGVALATIRRDIGVPDAEELKWKPPKRSFLAGAGGEIVQRLRAEMLTAALDHNSRSIVVILDYSAAYSSRTKAEAGREILKWLFERTSMLLTDHKDTGIMIADRPGGGGAEEGRWLNDTLSLTEFGTEYVGAGAIVMPIVTAPSHHLPHLQVADLVVGATTAAVAGIPAGLFHKEALRALAHRHSLGDVNGAGLVLFPDKLNLYYWALGETSCSRPSAQSGWSLPVSHMEYGVDDGLTPVDPMSALSEGRHDRGPT